MRRFSLGKLVAQCPQCGRRTFKPYMDNSTGLPLDVTTCGRCNREVNCGYHFTPRNWFDAGGRVGAAAKGWTPPPPQPPDFVMTPWKQSIEKLQTDTLFRFLSSRFGESKVLDVFHRYNVLHSLWHGGATTFFLTDSEGRARSAKLMRYNEDGHRVKSDNPAYNVTYLHSLLKLHPFNYRACFFGEHIAATQAESNIVLVESEKTALILACADKTEKNAYLATGGCSALRPKAEEKNDPFSRHKILHDRNVLLIPDADMVDKWKDVASDLAEICRSVNVVDVRLPPFRLTGSDDIGDFLV